MVSPQVLSHVCFSYSDVGINEILTDIDALKRKVSTVLYSMIYHLPDESINSE